MYHDIEIVVLLNVSHSLRLKHSLYGWPVGTSAMYLPSGMSVSPAAVLAVALQI